MCKLYATKTCSTGASWPLKAGPIGYPKKPKWNNRFMLRKIPEDSMSQNMFNFSVFPTGECQMVLYIYIYIYIHTHTHIYMCVCVCVCACARLCVFSNSKFWTDSQIFIAFGIKVISQKTISTWFLFPAVNKKKKMETQAYEVDNNINVTWLWLLK